MAGRGPGSQPPRVEMFQTAIAEHGTPRVVHADSGAAMTSNLLRDYLQEQRVELSTTDHTWLFTNESVERV